jgi:hypothetical protein
MNSLERLRGRLPSLWRPEPEDDGLLAQLLAAVARPLDGLEEEAGRVLSAHWVGHADRADQSPWALLGRRRQGRPVQLAADRVDLIDARAVAAEMRDGTGALTVHLREGFSTRTRRLLVEFDPERQPARRPSPSLDRALIDELGARTAGLPLFDEALFADVEIPEDLRAEATAGAEGPALLRLNLKLLAAAYPGRLEPARQDSPFLRDLARLGGLVSLPPWQQPAALRETVEGYRRRLHRTVDLYRQGLATPEALRRAVEIHLPLDPTAAPGLEDRPFRVEERPPLDTVSLALPEEVGALARWTVSNDGLAPVSPTVYLQGIAPEDGQLDPTVNPMIELYADAGGRARVGLAYLGTLAPGETLRLAPGRSSWIGLDAGLRRARSRPSETRPADPAAPGPWRAVEGAPAERVNAFWQARDLTLWAGTDDGLHRFDGRAWTAVDVPAVRCLAEEPGALLAGTAAGLQRVPLWPEPPGAFAPAPVAGLEDAEVNALLPDGEGGWWAGTATGVARLRSGGGVERLGPEVAVFALAADASGALHAGTALGLLQHHPSTGGWFFYHGAGEGDREPDWRELPAGTIPEEADVFLPPVRAILRGADSSLWLGTDAGLCRYVARGEGTTYATALEAFPDVLPEAVLDLREDERGVVWLCTGRGLANFDGRDLWLFSRDGGPDRWGAADRLADGSPRGSWRFSRADASWERREGTDWRPFANTAPRSGRTAVRTLLWTDQVEAQLGTWDGARFTPGAPVPEARLAVRVKPTEERIADGGLPALPRLAPGTSTWRSLSMEPPGLEPPPGPLPWWSPEGRLVPPPPREEAALPGRFDLAAPPAGIFDDVVFPYPPTVRVWMQWQPRRPLSVLVRLLRRTPGEAVDPAVIDRVWQGIQLVRPAGVRAALALEEEVVRDGRSDR